MTMGTDFETWLNEELQSRGWSQSELARRGGVNSSSINRIMSGERKPGSEVQTKKDLLGHSDFEMVEHYAHFVQADVQRDHQNASPVDNWKL